MNSATRITIPVGHSGQLTWTVGPQHVVHLGADHPNGGAVVFSTPNMILLMERAARVALQPFLEVGEESVGISVNIEHVAGTPISAQVYGQATVTRVDGRTVDFDVVARDDVEVLGCGSHRRAIVSLGKLRQRVSDKRNQLFKGNAVMSVASTDEVPHLKEIALVRSGAVLTATLNRPSQLNAIGSQLTADFEQLVAWLGTNPSGIRVVILTGAGRAFCAGSDVKEVSQRSLDDSTQISFRQARMLLALETLPQVVIAAVNGHALGGGCVMAYSCDFRVAASNAEFGMPEILLGWPPGYGIAQLTALIGKAHAMELCTTGRQIKASEALAMGLVNRVVPSSKLMEATGGLAQQLLAMPANALSETKRLIHADQGELPKVTHLADTAAYIRCLELPDAREGMSAFMEKRTPRFS